MPGLARSWRSEARYAALLPPKWRPITAFSAFRTAFVPTRAYELATAREYAAVNAACGSCVTREIEAAAFQRTGFPKTVQRAPLGKTSWPVVTSVFSAGPAFRGALQSFASRAQR